MKLNKKVTLTVSLCIIFALVYICLASKKLSNELTIIPKWTVSILTKEADETRTTKSLIPFKLGQNIGFITPNGTIASAITFPYGATISNQYYAIYNADGTNIAITQPNKNAIGTIQDTGFPFFTDNGLYLMLPGGMGFFKIDEEGNKVWEYEDICPITAFTTSNAGSCIGFADGKLVILNNDGTIVSSVYPAGSNYQVILGNSLSDSGNLSATVCGIDNQRFVLYSNTGNHNKIIFHKYLDKSLREQTIVKFTKNEEFVIFAESDGIGIVNTKTFDFYSIPIVGKVISIAEMSDTNLCFILSKNDSEYTITVIENPAHKIGQFSFSGRNAFLSTEGKDLYIGRDFSISKFEVSQ